MATGERLALLGEAGGNKGKAKAKASNSLGTDARLRLALFLSPNGFGLDGQALARYRSAAPSGMNNMDRTLFFVALLGVTGLAGCTAQAGSVTSVTCAEYSKDPNAAALRGYMDGYAMARQSVSPANTARSVGEWCAAHPSQRFVDAVGRAPH